MMLKSSLLRDLLGSLRDRASLLVLAVVALASAAVLALVPAGQIALAMVPIVAAGLIGITAIAALRRSRRQHRKAVREVKEQLAVLRRRLKLQRQRLGEQQPVLEGRIRDQATETVRMLSGQMAESVGHAHMRIDVIYDSAVNLGRHVAAIDDVLRGTIWAAETQGEYRLLADLSAAAPAGEAAQKTLQQLEVEFLRVEEDLRLTTQVAGEVGGRLKLLEESVLTNAANMEQIIRGAPEPERPATA